MNPQSNTFNGMLIRYNKYLRKRRNLMLENRNKRRQLILDKHIARLWIKLSSMQASFRKGAIAIAIAGAGILAPQLTQAQTSFAAAQTNPFSLTNVPGGYYGGQSSASFVDIDGDGDQDMFSGESYGGNFYYFENTGTASAPNFAAWVKNPFSITATNGSASGRNSNPTFGDVDGDGDLDMMAGRAGFQRTPSIFFYYENVGTATSPSFAVPQQNPFSLQPVDIYGTTPYWADLDGDGDLDLSSRAVSYASPSGAFQYHENTGSASSPNYAAGQLNPFGFTNMNMAIGITFGDLDGDGDLDYLDGSYSGTLQYRENTGSASAPSFGAVQTNPFGISGFFFRPAPDFVDLDNDGDQDIMLGNFYAGFQYLENTSPTNKTGEGLSDLNAGSMEVQLYPNPVTDKFHLQIHSSSASDATLQIRDLLGREVEPTRQVSLMEGSNTVHLNAEGLAAGGYFVTVTTKTETRQTRFVK